MIWSFQTLNLHELAKGCLISKEKTSQQQHTLGRLNRSCPHAEFIHEELHIYEDEHVNRPAGRPPEQTTEIFGSVRYQRALCYRGGANPVASPFFLWCRHQQPIRKHPNRDIKRRERGHQWTTYGGSRCPHNMTPKHTGLLNAVLINDYNIDSTTSNTPTHTH